MLQLPCIFSEPAVLRLLGSSGDRLPWLLLLAFLTLASRHLSGFGMILILDDDVWSFLCFVGVLLFGFYFPLCFLGAYGCCVLPGREYI